MQSKLVIEDCYFEENNISFNYNGTTLSIMAKEKYSYLDNQEAVVILDVGAIRQLHSYLQNILDSRK